MGYYQLISMMPKTPGIDPDAQAFITAASITNPTQQTAINNLVTGLKTDGIWTKMKALYPFVGGTASAHKFNLKDPRDLDAAFRLVFSGGWIHSVNGATPNGTNGYADTFLKPSNFSQNSISGGSYVNSNATFGLNLNRSDVLFGASNIGFANGFYLLPISSADSKDYSRCNQDSALGFSNWTDPKGFFQIYRTISTTYVVKRNTTNSNYTVNSSAPSSNNIWIASLNNNGLQVEPSNNRIAFVYFGDGLTDTEATNFYTRVQAFQTTLGRSIGTQTVSDADAQAFVTNAGIVDQVEANAINNLVIGLKADNLWTKMKAVYPFVGGTSTTNKYNLKNPLDTDAAFRLVFNGGWTFSSTGATPNGTNAFADTKLLASTQLALNSTHVSVYSRTNTDVLAPSIANATGAVNNETSLFLRTSNLSYLRINTPTSSTQSTTDSRGTFIGNRTLSTQQQLMIRGTRYDYSVNSNSLNSTTNYSLSGLSGGTLWDTKQLAFASIGDGLTNTDMTNLTTRINNFQLALNRNV